MTTAKLRFCHRCQHSYDPARGHTCKPVKAPPKGIDWKARALAAEAELERRKEATRKRVQKARERQKEKTNG